VALDLSAPGAGLLRVDHRRLLSRFVWLLAQLAEAKRNRCARPEREPVSPASASFFRRITRQVSRCARGS